MTVAEETRRDETDEAAAAMISGGSTPGGANAVLPAGVEPPPGTTGMTRCPCRMPRPDSGVVAGVAAS